MASGATSKRPKLVDLLNEAAKAKSTLVRLLQEAARLEHCLLNTYLFAASSLKTLPEEFATLRDGTPNQRRAIQFERVRDWKLSILSITHEEMMHLHYVQCLLRALGEPADFTLPERSSDSGDWHFEGWRARIGTEEPEHGTEVPVEPLTPDSIKRFIHYEATDALQDVDPFGEKMTQLFDELHDFEVEYRLEESLVNVPDEQRNELRDKLLDILHNLQPSEKPPPPGGYTAAFAGPPVSDFERVRFQSIADLYKDEILPRYHDAFVLGQVVNDNRDLNNELANTGERMLPIGPIQRDKNFERQEQLNIRDPLANYDTVDHIIGQIVDEGEGMTDFIEAAEEILIRLKEQGVPALLSAVRMDQGFVGGISGDGTAPDWLKRFVRARNSHLYRFAMIRAQLDAEQRLAQKCGESFRPARRPIPVPDDPLNPLGQFTAEAIAHFNACYLVLRTWLSRYYDPRSTQTDQRRRIGLEVLAGWPMMSVAIRPFLELLAILPIRGSDLFRSDDEPLAAGPPGTAELNDGFNGGQVSGAAADVMDRYALQILDATAKWARAARAKVQQLTTDTTQQAIITRRLQALSILDEFQRQIVYREHGGYSDTEAGAGYPRREPDRYEEVPLGRTAKSPPLFAESLVLRLRFSGRCLVQLATDPEPPTDEAGCSGTMMLTAADAPAHLDRALVMQPVKADNIIIREPQDRLPPLGVQVREVALMVTDYPSGSTRTVSVPGGNPAEEPKRVTIEGLNPILVCDPKELLGEHNGLGIDLLDRDGIRPYLNGENHLVWEDGEPIDPFILAVTLAADGTKSSVELFRREIYNEGRTFMQMDPQQRARSLRGPVAFDRITNVPGWVRATLSPPELIGLNSTSGYLDDRAAALADAISRVLEPGQRSQAEVDSAVSMLERRRRVVNPKRTTVDWLDLLLHYGHTVSGPLCQRDSGDNVLITKFAERCGLNLTGADTAHGRDESNGRWMMSYGLGYMDTDQLSDLTYGELLIPLHNAVPANGPLTLTRTWPLAATTEEISAYACRFDRPFAQPSYGAPSPPYAVVDEIRELRHPGYPPLRETLLQHEPNSYTYGIAGLPGLTECTAIFAASTGGDRNNTLTWTVSFGCNPPLEPIRAVALFAAYGTALETALYQRFSV